MNKKILILLMFIVYWGAGVNSAFAYLDGALIRAIGDTKVYALEDGLKRWIVNPSIFNGLGYKWSNIQVLPQDTLNSYILGSELSTTYPYPNGSLLKGDGPEVYLIEAGKKRWIPNPQIFEAKGFQWKNIINVKQYILNYLTQGSDVPLNEKDFRPSTFITQGPCSAGQENVPTVESTEITFKFSGHDPLGEDKYLVFETFLEGYDQRWQTSYSYERKINLDRNGNIYTFYVRSKNRAGYYDNTPVFCSFTARVSPYKDKIIIFSVSGYGTNPNYESITLGTGYSLKESVDITGWTIKSRKGNFSIPGAVKIINPESMYNIERDIYLHSGESVIIYGGKSPIQESGFALNKCWWQINDSQKYKDCFYAHNQDPDFLSGGWRIYLNRASEIFNDKEEKISLLDSNGLVVDTYTYSYSY